MERTCWYQKVELGDVFKKNQRNLPSSNDPSNSSERILRRRSKSTSSGGVDNLPTETFRLSKRTSESRRLSGNSNSSAGVGVDCNDSDNNNVNSPSRISYSAGNILAWRREFLKNNFNNSHITYKQKTRFVEIMNAVLLTCVFLMGALSAVFLTVCYKNGDFGGGSGGRTVIFQPFPHSDQLQVMDASYFDPRLSDQSNFDMEDNECDGENKLALELEAISSVRSALEKKDEGKNAKAQKLFKHAMALCPRHPDVLTHYGEFFEETRQDYMMADHLYVQALTYSPRHTKALVNRKRTLPVVEELDEKRMKRIDSKREQLLQLSETNRALRRIRKEAYFQHIYHSAGIEGNTMTLAETRSIVETRMAVGGKSIIEHNEILGLDAALRFINSSLVNRVGKITLKDILLIHKHLMGFVDPSEAGKLRRTQVFVGNHVPPKPEILLDEMNQFLDWLNSEEALSLHPIHYGAIAHYKFVFIHPFLDGNGRTSRLLMNWILMQANYPPVIIRKQDRQFYYDHINTANKGDLRPFIRFIGDCTEKTMDVYLWATQEHYQVLELEDDQDQIGGREEGSAGI